MSDISRTNNLVIQAVQGGGFTGELIRKYDWSKTALGNFSDWPQSLQSALGICINSNFPIAIYWGKELVLLYNDAWSPIPGSKHPWALGKTAMQVWPDIWADIEPQFQKAFSGTPGGSKDALLPMQRHGYTEECYFDFTFTPIFGESGKVEGIFNAVIETTYRVINERRAALLQKLSDAINSVTTADEVFRRTSAVLDSAQADVAFYCIADGEGTVKAGSTGFSEDLAIWSLNENAHGTIRHIQNLNDLGIDLPVSYWPESPTEAVVVPLKAPDGTITGHLIAGLSARRRYEKEYRAFFESLSTIIAGELNTIRSLDEERKRTEALAQIDKAKTAFFSNISHEFRTPLTLMLGPLQSVLEENGHLTEHQRENLNTSYRNTLRLQKLVNTLLDFSKIEAGRMEAKPKPVDLSTLTTNIASTFRSAIESAGIKYVVSVTPASAIAEIDVEMYEKVVLNLISNAFKYTTAGEIRIQLSKTEERILLSVSDTGVGISSEDLPRIFERFYRANNAQGRSQEGTGIGLSMVKELVHLMAGEIEVQSEVRKGTVFTVTLPAVKEHLIEAIAETTGSENGSKSAFIQEAHTWIDHAEAGRVVNETSKKSHKVLIADDNRDMREYISRLLENEFQVIAVSNGEEAFDKALSEIPDVILSDIMMPVLDGFGLLKKLKSTFQTRNIPVIFLSARAGDEAKVDGLEAGADDYLVKPFSTRELVARVSNHIAISRARRESEKQFFNLFLQSPAHIHIMRGPNHVFEFFHPLAKEFTGRDLTGISIREFAPQLESQGYFAMLDQVYHEGKSFYLPESKAVLRKDNGELQDFYFNITYLPWKDVDGKILGILQFSFDVSAQVKATMQIRESEERFRLLANSIPQIIWITGAQGETEFVSDQWEKYTGHPAASGLSNLNDFIHPDDVQDVLKKWKEAVGTRKAWQVEYRLRNRSGDYKWFHGQTLPLTNENGDVVKWIGSASDIHDQKTANEQLESAVAERTKELIALNNLLQSRNEEVTQARSFLQTVLDSSVELISAFNTDLRYTFVNKRVKQILKSELADIMGKHVLEVDPGFEKSEGYKLLQRALKGETIHIDNRRPLINDNLVLETFVTPLRSAGKIVGVLSMHRDVTKLVRLTEELKNTNRDLLRSNEDLQQFAHVTSHDLREPVRKIKMYENLLRTNFGELIPAKGQSYLHKIEHAANRITSMIESVLQYSSIDAVQYDLEPVDLNTVIAEIREDLEIPIRNTNAIIRTENLPIIEGARPLIFQLFYNILNNSLKFIRNDVQPVIEIRGNQSGLAGERLEQFHRIDVSDNGIGFDQSSAERIFDSFHRLNAKDKFEGTGLGLALCKRIAERHNGFLKAFGKLNEGATFSVFIPKALN